MQPACDGAGRGECVVLIHGHPFGRALWEPHLPNLEAEREFNDALRAFLLAHSPG